METPIETIIKMLKESLDSYMETLAKEPNNAYIAGRCKEKQEMILLLTSYLPKEQEAIEEGYNQGHFDGNSIAQVMNKEVKTYKSATDYFNQTYKDNE